jgi:uncharacterized membrane protein YjjP (DUF1212 family)
VRSARYQRWNAVVALILAGGCIAALFRRPR